MSKDRGTCHVANQHCDCPAGWDGYAVNPDYPVSE